jgi:NTP pyrophosphatase (non-canonical NTP hydrolase)
VLTNDFLLEFRKANKARLEEESHGVSLRESFDTEDWLGCLIGEIGEAANIVKKLYRIQLGWPSGSGDVDYLRALAEEYADCFVYLDIYAMRWGTPRLGGDAEILQRKVDDYTLKFGYAPPLQAFTKFCDPLAALEAAGMQGVTRIEALQDILAMLIALTAIADLDYEAEIRAKFNVVSDRMGSEIRL